jgi:hypothetical protein
LDALITLKTILMVYDKNPVICEWVKIKLIQSDGNNKSGFEALQNRPQDININRNNPTHTPH